MRTVHSTRSIEGKVFNLMLDSDRRVLPCSECAFDSDQETCWTLECVIDGKLGVYVPAEGNQE